MAITRRSLFGIPPQPTQGSTNTWRAVPLTQGLQGNAPFPLWPPGSAISMSNFVPQNGYLAPRSRLSSLNTLRTVESAIGMAALVPADSATANLWYSGLTVHGLMVASGGSISRASFVSSFGLGVAGIASASQWQYATVYLANISQNGLVAAGTSSNTLMVLYQTSGTPTGLPLYSYLTSAPQAVCVTTFDSYVIAWHTREANVILPQRVRWCVRGNPSNWTSEGAGFEDLLSMSGRGTAARGTDDGRFLLFTDKEIWYGVSATYPAQFQFAALERNVGCVAALTIADTDRGLLFVGTDNALRLLPRGGGLSQIVVPSLTPVLRAQIDNTAPTAWALYDSDKKLYWLFFEPASGVRRGIVVNVETGEWGYADYNDSALRCGAILRNSTGIPGYAGGHEGVFFGNSNGTLYSTSSIIATDAGSAVTAFVQLGPLAPELAGNYKQVTKVCLDYRATSKSTVTLKLSQDGGNNYEATGVMMSLASAPVAGRVEKDVYSGGVYPALELKSESTGFQLHRLDVSMDIGGRR